MSYTVLFAGKARKEILSAREWYEGKQDGLGDKYLATIDELIAQIQYSPKRGVQRRKGYYEVVANKFPYVLIYRVSAKDETILVVSVFHTKRNPRRKYIP